MMYLPRGWKIQAQNNKKMGQKDTHGLWHGHLHGRASVAEPGYKGKEREMEGKMDVCLDRLSYDLDTEFTTKS